MKEHKELKGTVYHWCGNHTDCEFKHKQEIPSEDIFKVATSIFESGLNVMLLHSGENTVVIGVDDKRFQQR